MSDSFYLCRLFSFCGSCSTEHHLHLACGEKRDELEKEHLCPFCNEQYSYLDDHFHPDDRYPTIGTCLRLIDNDFDDHFCEQRVKRMTINRHRDICDMCVKEQFPDGANQENTQSVECKDFLHPRWFCGRFCIYCFMHKGELNEHDYHRCKNVPQRVQYELEQVCDQEYGFD